MSPRQDNLECQYLLLAIAFETLASYAQALSERNAKVIVNILKQEKEKDIIYLSKKTTIPFPDLLVEELLKLGRFNDIRLKDKIRYIFDNLLLT